MKSLSQRGFSNFVIRVMSTIELTYQITYNNSSSDTSLSSFSEADALYQALSDFLLDETTDTW